MEAEILVILGIIFFFISITSFFIARISTTGKIFTFLRYVSYPKIPKQKIHRTKNHLGHISHKINL